MVGCIRWAHAASGATIRADDGDELLEQTFLERFGDERVTRRVFVPGEDHSDELEDVNATIARLRGESDAGLIVSDDDERVYLARMRSQIDRRTKLEALPTRQAGWVTETTDQTYHEVWADSDHRQLLIDKGVRFVLNSAEGRALNFDLKVPA